MIYGFVQLLKSTSAFVSKVSLKSVCTEISPCINPQTPPFSFITVFALSVILEKSVFAELANTLLTSVAESCARAACSAAIMALASAICAFEAASCMQLILSAQVPILLAPVKSADIAIKPVSSRMLSFASSASIAREFANCA